MDYIYRSGVIRDVLLYLDDPRYRLVCKEWDSMFREKNNIFISRDKFLKLSIIEYKNMDSIFRLFNINPNDIDCVIDFYISIARKDSLEKLRCLVTRRTLSIDRAMKIAAIAKTHKDIQMLQYLRDTYKLDTDSISEHTYRANHDNGLFEISTMAQASAREVKEIIAIIARTPIKLLQKIKRSINDRYFNSRSSH